MIETLRTWRLLRSLRVGARRSPEARALLQADLLRSTVDHARERVPLYRRHWAGVDTRGPVGLARLPILSAETLREAVACGELAATAGVPAFPTSGSTGQPLWIPRGPAEQRRWRAAALRIWFEHGYRWRDVTANLDANAGPPHPLQRVGISRTHWISTELDVAEQVELLARASPDVVVGTPTVLRRIARAVEGGAVRPRIVLCHGEVLDPATSELVERALGARPVGLYGLTELGYVAWQCERRAGYHVSAETCLVEVLHDGRPARPGELGRVVVTDLIGRTMPLVRYDTGDLAVAGGRGCPCGRTLPLLASIEGRARDAAELRGRPLLTTRALVEHMAGVLTPDQYRLRRESETAFELGLHTPARGGANGAAGHVLRLLGDVDLRVLDGLPPAGGVKTRPLAEVGR